MLLVSLLAPRRYRMERTLATGEEKAKM